MAAAAILREMFGGPERLGIGWAIPKFRSGWRCIFLGGGPAKNDDRRDQHQREQGRDCDFVRSAGQSMSSVKLRPTLSCANTDAPDANSAYPAGISNFTIVFSSSDGFLWYPIIAAVKG